MWFHIFLFLLFFLLLALQGFHVFRTDVKEKKEGFRLLLFMLLAGNLCGLFLTVTDQNKSEQPVSPVLEKQEGSAYEVSCLVKAEGEEEREITLLVPPAQVGGEAEEGEKEEASDTLAADISRFNLELGDGQYYYLPAEWEGKKLSWRYRAGKRGTILSALFLLAGFSLLILKQREEGQKREKRREMLLSEYPTLIMKFTLLLHAGMSSRKAFRRIGSDYLRRAKAGKQLSGEEILVMNHEMDTGVSELEAYRRFGERCGQVRYKTFSTLLIQNLQRGSAVLTEQLEREAVEAWDERKRKARIRGEEAGTRLLLPMILMLLLVMVIIMVPAFLSF